MDHGIKLCMDFVKIMAICLFPSKPSGCSQVFTYRLLLALTMMFFSRSLIAEANVGNITNGVPRAKVMFEVNQGMRIETRHDHLEQIFDRITVQTGMKFHYTHLPKVPAGTICAGPSISDIVKCLLGPGGSFVLHGSGGMKKSNDKNNPLEIWVLNNSDYENTDQSVIGVLDVRRLVTPSGTDKKNDSGANDNLYQAGIDDIDRLLKMANSEDPTTRGQALAQLASSEYPKDYDRVVQEALELALLDSDSSVRAQALLGLAQRNDTNSVGIFQEALNDDDSSIRLLVVDSVGDDAQSIALLRQALTDEEKIVSDFAKAKLDAFLRQFGKPTIDGDGGEFGVNSQQGNDTVNQDVSEMSEGVSTQTDPVELEHNGEEKNTRSDSGLLLAEPGETERLLDMAFEVDPVKRATALSQLAVTRHLDDQMNAVRDALELGLSDQDPRVRAQAVFGLARWDDSDAVIALQAAMSDVDSSVRLMAVDSVRNDPQSIALLHQPLNDGDTLVSDFAKIKLEYLSR